MVSASVILGTVLLLGLLGFGIAQVALDAAHGTTLAGAVVQQVDQRDLNLCMNNCMRGCVTTPGTEKGCTDICSKQCGAN